MCALCVLEQHPGLLSWIRTPAEKLKMCFHDPGSLFQDHSGCMLLYVALICGKRRVDLDSVLAAHFHNPLRHASIDRVYCQFTVCLFGKYFSLNDTVARTSPAFCLVPAELALRCGIGLLGKSGDV